MRPARINTSCWIAGNPQSVIYSVTLYERGQWSQLLRVQTDNYNQPLDINQGTRLQLGSTAKLRTLINYLQIIEELHDRYAEMPARRFEIGSCRYSRGQHHSMGPRLPFDRQRQKSGADAAKPRSSVSIPAIQARRSLPPAACIILKISNPPKTAGIFTVAEGFQHSVNLVFIRLMRDIEHYYMYRVPGADPGVLTDPNDPARQRYLDRFADFEGAHVPPPVLSRSIRDKPSINRSRR